MKVSANQNCIRNSNTIKCSGQKDIPNDEIETNSVTHLNLQENNLESVDISSENRWESLQFLDLRKESASVSVFCCKGHI